MGLFGRRASGLLIAVALGAIGFLGLSLDAAASVPPVQTSSVLEPPHSDRGVDTDTPANGLFNVLEVDVAVNVTTSGVYVVEGVLKSGDGTVTIFQDSAGLSLSPGLRVVPLFFSGYGIINSGLDGPYRVDLTLLDSTFTPIDTGTHTTGAYAVASFDPPPATFDPPHADAGRETDAPPNGQYDELVLSVGLDVVLAGDYLIDADLRTLAGNFVTSEFVSTAVQPGPATIEVAFSGMEIRLSGRNGPYRAVLTLYEGSSFAYLDNDTHVTGPYQASDFDGPAVSFAPPHGDFGLDADAPADGLYDWLVVRATLQVNEVGVYILQGTLSDQFGFLAEAQAVANLTIGLRTMDLMFPGPTLRDLEANGPYFVQMYASKFREQFSAAGTHITAPYSHLQFAPPSGFLSGPHSEAGVDTSEPPDGRFDWLAIDVGVNATRAGPFEVEVFLIDSFSSNLIASGSARADLALGLQSARVLVEGHAIAVSGSPGPYTAFIELWDRHGVLVDTDVYFTRDYLPADFQPIDATTPVGIARVTGGYWRNGHAIPVDYVATDPVPSDGLESATLHYRFSLDNVTFGPWVAYATTTIPSGAASASGTVPFAAPEGDGFYEFAVTVADRAGNGEPAPGGAEAIAAILVPDRLEVSPAAGALVADRPGTFEIRVLTAGGRRAPLEAPLTIRLATSSRGGQFRSSGAPITEIPIPAGESALSVEYVDSIAGTALIIASANRIASGTSTIVVEPSSVLGTPLAQGLAAGTVAGVAAGIAAGWVLRRRLRSREPPRPPASP